MPAERGVGVGAPVPTVTRGPLPFAPHATRDPSPRPAQTITEVTPASIYRRKQAHREALWRLMDGIEDAIEDDLDVESRAPPTTRSGER